MKQLVISHGNSFSYKLLVVIMLELPNNSMVKWVENAGAVLGEKQNFCIIYVTCVLSHVRWVPCHHGMAHPQVGDGGDDLQIWRVAANILNTQSQADDKGWSYSLGGWAYNSSP
jgi:hypothetical protein